MKEKTQTASDSGEVPAEEKSSFEKFNDDIKITVFNVLYVLLNEGDDGSTWGTLINILMDFMQIWNLSFADVFAFPWQGGKIPDIMQLINDYQSIVWWVAKIDFLTFLVCFYICVFIIVLVMLDIFYVSYSFTKKKFPFIWPLRILRSVCSLFVTSLFMPILEEFFSIIHCKPPPPGSTLDPNQTYMDLFPDVECWTGTHIIHACISIAVTIVFISICLVVSFMFYESNSNSTDIEAKINARTDTFLTVMKIVLTLVSMFFPGEKYHWFSIAMLNIFGLIAYFKYKQNWPYYNDNMNKYYVAQIAIFCWANFCLVLVKILEPTNFDGGLQIYFLGIPIIAGGIFFENDRRVELLSQNITYFQKGEDYALQVRYFLHLVKSRFKDKRCNTLLNGFIFFHEDSCLHPDCHLKQYKKSIQSGKGRSNSSKNSKTADQSFDQEQLLLQHASNMYKLGIKQFPDSTSLKIQYALFLMDSLNKKSEALAMLAEVEKQKPPMDEQFLIFRYKRIFEEAGEGKEEAEDEGLDVVSMLAYESNLRQFQESILKSAQLHLSFWNQLQQESPDITKLNSCGEKINNSVFLVEGYWDKLQKLNANKPKALKMYARFLLEILNDKERGEDLIARANEASNIKQNYHESNTLHKGITDILALSSNGTPCIYVSGDSHQVGRITNCNAGACHLFGYYKEEMCNYHVERLMPEMYAKNHSKVLDDALQNSNSNVPSKERLVFAKHKSGYIFPVRLQLKIMIGASNHGVSFVALFKTDKKQISSDIAYVLINKEKKLQGISSSCMPLMNIDINKMKRLSISGLNIKQLAPSLFEGDAVDEIFHSRQGGEIEWYLPNFDLLKRHENQRQSLKEKFGLAFYNYMRIQQNKLIFNCHVSVITMGFFGEIGWVLKLQKVQEQKSPRAMNYRMNLETVKQPLFQFRFDERSGKFIRELRDNIFIDNAAKDPRYQDGFWVDSTTGEITGEIKNDDIEENSTSQGVEDPATANITGPVGSSPQLDPNAVEDTSNNLMIKKRAWADKIQTYRLEKDVFVLADFDSEFKKQKELEKQILKQPEDDLEEQKENIKHNMQQRRQLQNAIKNKSTPSSITSLRIAMTAFILSLVGLSIAEFVLMNKEFKDVNENFKMIYYSRGRITEIQRIAFDVRALILINNHNLTTYRTYTTEPDFITYIRDDLEDSLNKLYQLQNNISSSKLVLAPQHESLNDNKEVSIFFKEYDGSKKEMKFSLTDAVLQVSSAAFALKYLDLSFFNDMQEDTFLIIQNVYHDFLIDLKSSAKYYLEEMFVKTREKTRFLKTMFFTALGVLFLVMVVLFTMINRVSLARVKILALFVDIPDHSVMALSVKCENFIMRCQQDDQYDENDLKEDDAKAEEVIIKSQVTKKRSSKHVRNLINSNSKVLVQFSIALFAVMAYQIGMYFMSVDQLTRIKVFSKEMNIMAQAEQYFCLSQNILRELIYEPSKTFLNVSSDVIARDTLNQIYQFNYDLIKTHQQNQNTFTHDYIETFESIYLGDLCTSDVVQLSLIPIECTKFLSGAGQHGLQTVLVNYFEMYREQLTKYYQMKESGKSVQGLLDTEPYRQLYFIQHRFVKDSFRKIVDLLLGAVENNFKERITIRLAAFAAFVVITLSSYVILWVPFINKLHKEIQRTKQMLTIIPMEVIQKIPRIQEFLLNQNYF